MNLQVGVKILLKNSEGKYLFARRNPKKYPEVGPKWDIVGGRIYAGTSLMENLRREIKEEVGLDYIGEPILVAAQDILDDHKSTNSTNDDKHVVRLTYTGELEGVPIVDDDHLEAKWFLAEEIIALSENELDGYFRELLDKKKIIL